MIKKSYLLLVLLYSCSPKIYQNISSTSDSTSVSYKDTIISIKGDSTKILFNITDYCDSLSKLRKRDSTIKYIPIYIDKQSTGGIKAKIVIDSSGNATITAERDNYKLKFDSLIKNTFEKKEIVNTIIIEKCTSKWHHFCVSFFWIVISVLVIIIVLKIWIRQ